MKAARDWARIKWVRAGARVRVGVRVQVWVKTEGKGEGKVVQVILEGSGPT